MRSNGVGCVRRVAPGDHCTTTTGICTQNLVRAAARRKLPMFATGKIVKREDSAEPLVLAHFFKVPIRAQRINTDI